MDIEAGEIIQVILIPRSQQGEGGGAYVMKLGANRGFSGRTISAQPCMSNADVAKLLPGGSILRVMGFRLVSRSFSKTK